MKKSYKYLTICLSMGLLLGTCLGMLMWIFLHTIFSIAICAGLGMLIGIVIGTLIDYR